MALARARRTSPNYVVTTSRRETIKHVVDGSLQRLGADTIDLYYQHRVDPDMPV